MFLNLSDNQFGKFKKEDLAAGLSAIPDFVSSIDLSDNEFELMSSADLAYVVSFIPETVTEICFAENKLGHRSGEEVALILGSFHAKLIVLQIDRNELGLVEAPWLKKSILSLAITLKSLDISANDFNRQAGIDLADILSAHQGQIEFLDLSCNDLGLLPDDNLAIALRGIQSSVTSLDLSGNSLGYTPSDRLCDAFETIKNSVKFLNLSSNHLSVLGAGLSKALSGLKVSLDYLDLFANDLGNMMIVDLANGIESIYALIYRINFSMNGLNKLGGQGLSIFLKAFSYRNTMNISVKVRSTINLKLNDLGSLPFNDFMCAFSEHPDQLVSLELGNNSLRNYTCEELSLFFSTFLQGRTEPLQLIDLEYNSLDLAGEKLALMLSSLNAQWNTMLKLGYCNMGLMNVELIKDAISVIPPNNNSVSLSGCKFNALPKENLESIMDSFTPYVDTIDITENGLNYSTRTELIDFLNMITFTVSEVILDNEDVKNILDQARDYAFTQINQNLKYPELSNVIMGYVSNHWRGYSFWNKKRKVTQQEHKNSSQSKNIKLNQIKAENNSEDIHMYLEQPETDLDCAYFPLVMKADENSIRKLLLR